MMATLPMVVSVNFEDNGFLFLQLVLSLAALSLTSYVYLPLIAYCYSAYLFGQPLNLYAPVIDGKQARMAASLFICCQRKHSL